MPVSTATPRSPRAILFDLDDTLYDEASYVRSGLAAVAGRLAEIVAGREAEIRECLLRRFASSGRAGLFDHVLESHGRSAEPDLIADLVARYRAHLPAIQLAPDVTAMLRRLRRSYRLAIVTDGLPLMQRNKVAALKLHSLVDHVSYCWEHAPKPDPAGFRAALAALGVEAQEALVVGDNPAHDLQAALALGARALRIRAGRFAALPNPPNAPPEAALRSVLEIEAYLAKCGRTSGGEAQQSG